MTEHAIWPDERWDSDEPDELAHYGTPRHSGRYPWGSGENPYQRYSNFYGAYTKRRKAGKSNKEIAKEFDMSVRELLNRKMVAVSEMKRYETLRAVKLKEKGYSTTAIGRAMGINESSVRKLLEPEMQAKREIVSRTADSLESMLKEGKIPQIGLGTEHYMTPIEGVVGISRPRMDAAVQKLVDTGKYDTYELKVKQQGTGKWTTMKVLAKAGQTKKDLYQQIENVEIPDRHYEKDTDKFYKLEKPVAVDPSRVMVRYPKDGGADKDGVIELRRGVEDISLKDAHYAQVRINVGNTHYLKGMAVYSDNMPPGIDIVFNTSKPDDMPAMGKDKDNSVMKPLKWNDDTPENPFGATIMQDKELLLAQRHYIGKDGKEHLSALNIVNEEGNWGEWKKTLASQMLSKQNPSLAKQQLKLTYDAKKEEFDELMKDVDNPVIKKKLLKSFADSCDHDAVHLKAAGLPRQASRVILPFPEMNENEIYAPGLENGEHVKLIRYPHGGIFEIPSLRVNNNVAVARKTLGTDARDAVGINPKVARQLSGADFDGDTVLVIPDNDNKIRSKKGLKGLEDFEPKERYRGYEGMKKMTNTQNEMGKISNLITDMTIQGAPESELARAVRHSMVVIDAEKHNLDYTSSYRDNQIDQLKRKYQHRIDEEGKEHFGGASTLISRAKGQKSVYAREEGDWIKDPKTGKVTRMLWDPETGKKIYKYTGEKAIKKITEPLLDDNGQPVLNKKGKPIMKVVGYQKTDELKTIKSTQMAETDDAYKLSSGSVIENHYAEYANKMKALANEARKAYSTVESPKRDPEAAKYYSHEVSQLKAFLLEIEKMKPVERQAQKLAGKLFMSQKQEHPEWEDDDIKKARNRSQRIARDRLGAKKPTITLTDNQWKAIQANAISPSMLESLIANVDDRQLKEWAMPRNSSGMSTAKINHAKQLLKRGYTWAEVADQLNVSVATLEKNVNTRKEGSS